MKSAFLNKTFINKYGVLRLCSGQALSSSQSSESRVQSAFTLVELLVSMTIIVLIFVLSVSGYNGLRTTQLLKQSTQSLKSDIMYAKRSAMLVKRNQGENWINGIGIDLASMSMVEGGYRLFKYCSDDTGYVDFSTQNISTVITEISIPPEGQDPVYSPLSPDEYYGECESAGISEFTTVLGYDKVEIIAGSLAFTASASTNPLLNSVRFIFFESPTGEMHLYDCFGSEITNDDSVWLVYSLGSRSNQVKLNANGDIETGIYDGESTVVLENICENEIDIFEEP